MNVLLACTCGQKVAISFQDAGRQMKCKCGQAIEVPRLSELRKLANVVPEVQKLEVLSSRQLYGRVILGALLMLTMLVIMYEVFFLRANENHGFNIWKLFSAAFFCVLSSFTLLGRIWARLLLIVWLLFSTILVFVAYADIRDPVLLTVLVVYAVLIVCLMTIKT